MTKTTITFKQYREDAVQAANQMINNIFKLKEDRVDPFSIGCYGISNNFSFFFSEKVNDAIQKQVEGKAPFNNYEELKSSASLASDVAGVFIVFYPTGEKPEEFSNTIDYILRPQLPSFMNSVNANVMFPAENANSIPLNEFMEKGLEFEPISLYDVVNELSSRGFVYDRSNCFFGKQFKDVETVTIGMTDNEIKDLEYRKKIFDILKSDDRYELADFLESGFDANTMYGNYTLLSYAIYKDKPECFEELMYETNNILEDQQGKLNLIWSIAGFQVLHEIAPYERYLEKLFKSSKFDMKGQDFDLVDAFVKTLFFPHKISLSEQVFLAYKDRFDEKSLALALVKNNSVYMMESPVFSEWLEKAFKEYSQDIIDMELVTNTNYYLLQDEFLALLKYVPDIKVKVAKPIVEELTGEMSDVINQLTSEDTMMEVGLKDLYTMRMDDLKKELEKVTASGDTLVVKNGKICDKTELIAERINEIEVFVRTL